MYRFGILVPNLHQEGCLMEDTQGGALFLQQWHLLPNPTIRAFRGPEERLARSSPTGMRAMEILLEFASQPEFPGAEMTSGSHRTGKL